MESAFPALCRQGRPGSEVARGPSTLLLGQRSRDSWELCTVQTGSGREAGSPEDRAPGSLWAEGNERSLGFNPATSGHLGPFEDSRLPGQQLPSPRLLLAASWWKKLVCVCGFPTVWTGPVTSWRHPACASVLCGFPANRWSDPKARSDACCACLGSRTLGPRGSDSRPVCCFSYHCRRGVSIPRFQEFLRVCETLTFGFCNKNSPRPLFGYGYVLKAEERQGPA